MFQFMLVVGLVLAYYGYAVTKNPRIWGDQGRDAIKEENWNRYVRYNGQFAMYAGFLMAALDALDMAVDLSTAIYLLILLGGLAILLYPFAHWMHENEGTWNPWPRVETEKQKRKRLIKEQARQEKMCIRDRSHAAPVPLLQRLFGVGLQKGTGPHNLYLLFCGLQADPFAVPPAQQEKWRYEQRERCLLVSIT